MQLDDVMKAKHWKLVSETCRKPGGRNMTLSATPLLRSSARNWDKAICSTSVHSEFVGLCRCIRRFRDREFGLENIKSSMRNMYVDLLSRSPSTPSIAERGVAMQAQDDLSGVKCYICRRFGHRKADCPKYKPCYKKTRKGGSSKWYSLRKTTSHSDDECRAKGNKHCTQQKINKVWRRSQVVISALGYAARRHHYVRVQRFTNQDGQERDALHRESVCAIGQGAQRDIGERARDGPQRAIDRDAWTVWEDPRTTESRSKGEKTTINFQHFF